MVLTVGISLILEVVSCCCVQHVHWTVAIAHSMKQIMTMRYVHSAMAITTWRSSQKPANASVRISFSFTYLLLLARYVAIWVYEICVRSMNIDDRPTTDDRPQGPFTHFGKISNGHNSATRQPIPLMFGSSAGFSGTADRTAPFPVGSNSRWRPAAILENFKRPYIQQRIIRFTACMYADLTLPLVSNL